MVLAVHSSYFPKEIYQLKQWVHWEQGRSFVSRDETKFMLQIETHFHNHSRETMYT